jgi:hypothetical protein
VTARARRLADASRAGAIRPGWPGRMRLALGFALGEPDAAMSALAGFLVRGGIVPLALPAAVLPSLIGIAGIFGVSAFAIDGSPTPLLYEIAVLGVVAVGAWLVTAGVIGSLMDLALIRAAAGEEGGAGDGGGAGGHATGDRGLDVGLVIDMAAIRGICLLPLAAALAWASTRIYDTSYSELLAPSNLATPLVARVVLGATDAIAAVAIAWLIGETVAALAVRRLVLAGAGVRGALVGALAQCVKRPLATILTAVATFGGGVLLTGTVMAATAVAFDWCRVAARNPHPIALSVGLGPLTATRDFRPVAFGLTALALAAVWLAGAAISGIGSAWRNAAWTGEVVSALDDRGRSVQVP